MSIAARLFRSILLLGIVLLTAVGCSTKRFLNDSDRASLRNQTVIPVVHYVTPLPEVQPPKVHVAPYSNVKLHDSPTGAEIQSNLGNYDPTAEVAQRFSRDLARTAGLKNLRLERNAAPLPPPKNPKSLQDHYKSGVVLEVWIERWGFHYVPIDWKTYTLTLNAKARLTRISDGQVLWNVGDCHYAGAGQGYEHRLVLADLKTSDSKKTQAKLRQIMGQIADGCARQLLDDYRQNH